MCEEVKVDNLLLCKLTKNMYRSLKIKIKAFKEAKGGALFTIFFVYFL